MWFEYGERETRHLALRDPRLGEFIALRGHVVRERIAEPFEALLNAIAGQQISGKALKTVWGRLQQARLTTPEAVLGCSEEALAQLGLGPRKARFVREAARRAGELSELGGLSDSECVRRLMDFPGVGRWTAEMFLIFCLNRMDVLSEGDFGIAKGLNALHGEGAAGEFSRWRAAYSPYGSVASLYLWELALGTVAGGKNAQL